jgi:hypothetical protein
MLTRTLTPNTLTRKTAAKSLSTSRFTNTATDVIR